MVRLLLIVFFCSLTLVAVVFFYAFRMGTEQVQVGSTQLKQLGMALYQYHEDADHFPEGGSPANGGWKYPGWQFALLPYLGHHDLDRRLNRTVAWDSKENRAVFETEVKEFLGDNEIARKTDDGLAISHFAGSKGMFPSRDYRRIGDVLDGTSNTLMAGEIGADFPAWGSPVNTRDPALGLDGKFGHFGRSDGSGAMFLIADGSVRSFSANVDPRILKVLSTPDGNEVAPPPYYDEKSFLIPTVTDEDRFRFTYEIPIDEQFGVVTAPSFRDDVLTESLRRPDVEVSLQDFNSSRSKAHQILMFSEAAMRAARETEKNNRPLWSTGTSKTQVTQMACLFAQTRADDRTSGELFTLIKTAETLGVRDLLSCFDRVLFVMNTEDGIPPDFGFNGDLVVKSYPIRRYRRQSDAIEGQLDAIVFSLQEYCLDGPEHLRDLRFNVLKDQEVWVPKDESLVVGLDVHDQPEPQSPDQVKSHQALCATLGVSTDLSECLIPFAEIISLDTLSLPPSKADQKRDPQMAAQQFKQIRDAFAAHVLAKTGKIVEFEIMKVTVVECTRITEQLPDPAQ